MSVGDSFGEIVDCCHRDGEEALMAVVMYGRATLVTECVFEDGAVSRIGHLCLLQHKLGSSVQTGGSWAQRLVYHFARYNVEVKTLLKWPNRVLNTTTM